MLSLGSTWRLSLEVYRASDSPAPFLYTEHEGYGTAWTQCLARNLCSYLLVSGIQPKVLHMLCVFSELHSSQRPPVLCSPMLGISVDLRGFQEPVPGTNKVRSVGWRRAGAFFQSQKALLASPLPWANRASVWAAPARQEKGGG